MVLLSNGATGGMRGPHCAVSLCVVLRRIEQSPSVCLHGLRDMVICVTVAWTWVWAQAQEMCSVGTWQWAEGPRRPPRLRKIRQGPQEQGWCGAGSGGVKISAVFRLFFFGGVRRDKRTRRKEPANSKREVICRQVHMSESQSLNEDGWLCWGGLSLGKNEEAPFLPFLIRSVMGQHFVAVLLLVADRKRSEHMQCKLYVLLFFHRFIYKVLPSLGMASSVASWASARGPVSVVLHCTDRGLTENRCRYGMQALPLSTLACMRKQAMPVLILFLLLFFLCRLL